MLHQHGFDLEAAILHSSSHSELAQQSADSLQLGSVNDHRSSWASPDSTDLESIAAFIHSVHLKSLTQREQSATSGTCLSHAIFAPERKALCSRQAELDCRPLGKASAGGDWQVGSALQEPRHVLNAVDKTQHTVAENTRQQPSATAARQQQPAGSLAQAAIEQSSGVHAEQHWHLDRHGSRTDSTLTQLPIPVPTAQAANPNAMSRDAGTAKQTDSLRLAGPQSRTHAVQRPADAALSKLPSVNSRVDQAVSNAANSARGASHDAALGADQAAASKSAKKGLHEYSTQRLQDRLKGPSVPSRFAKGKAGQPAQHAAKHTTVPASSGQSDQNLSRSAASGDVACTSLGPDTAAASRAHPGQKTASARYCIRKDSCNVVTLPHDVSMCL